MNWDDYLNERWMPEATAASVDPREQEYGVIREPSWGDAVNSFIHEMTFPKLRNYINTGEPDVGIVGEVADTLAGKIGSLAKAGMAGMKALPAVGGMVQMGGKRYPEAFLHRAIDQKEIPYLNKLIQEGVSSTKPMTLVAPDYPFTFEPFRKQQGLMFNAPEGAIKRMWPRDVSSVPAGYSLLDRPGLIMEDWVKGGELSKLEINPTTTNIFEYLERVKQQQPKASRHGGSQISHGEIVSSYGPETLAGVYVHPDALKSSVSSPFFELAQERNLPVFSFGSSSFPKVTLGADDHIAAIENILRNKQIGMWRQPVTDDRGRKIIFPEGWEHIIANGLNNR